MCQIILLDFIIVRHFSFEIDPSGNDVSHLVPFED